MNARQQAPYFSATYPADKLHGDEGLTEYTAAQERALREAAEDDLAYGDYWGDLMKGPQADQMAAMCESLQTGADNEALGRMFRHFYNLSVTEAMSDD